MRNWSKSKKTFWQSLRIKGTKKILKFAYNLKEPKLKILDFLKTHAEYHLHPRDYDLIACPSNLEVKLDKVCFSDLFFPEDFPKLQEGLNKLLSDYPANFGSDLQQLNESFSNIYNSGSGSASSFYVSLLFKGKKISKPIKSLQSAGIHLKYISPSFIILSIIVDPSNEFIEKFNKLIKTIPSPQNEILGLNFKIGITGLTSIPASLVRKAEFEELFLDINKSIVWLLRKYVGVGLSCFGSLPCLEIIETNVSLKEIPKNQNLRQTPNKFQACCRFFESFGYPFNLQPIYQKNDWWIFYPVNRNELFYKKSQTYQILISSADYEKSHNLSERYFYQSASRSIYYTINDLLSLLALQHFYEVLENIIIDLKNELEPHLNSQISGKITLRNLKSAISKMVILNGFYYQHSRIFTGVDKNFSWDFMCSEVADISREKYNKDDSGLFQDDIKYNIEGLQKFCKEQLNLMRLSYEQMLSYKMASATYKLGQSTFWLSIVVAFLTVVTLIPENIRQVLINKIWVWLTSFL